MDPLPPSANPTKPKPHAFHTRTVSTRLAQEVLGVYDPAITESSPQTDPEAIAIENPLVSGVPLHVPRARKPVLPRLENVDPRPKTQEQPQPQPQEQEQGEKTKKESNPPRKKSQNSNVQARTPALVEGKKRTLKNTTRAIMFASRMKKNNQSVSVDKEVFVTAREGTRHTSSLSSSLLSSSSSTPTHHRSRTGSSLEGRRRSLKKKTLKGAARSVLYAAKLGAARRKSVDTNNISNMSDLGEDKRSSKGDGSGIEMTTRQKLPREDTTTSSRSGSRTSMSASQNTIWDQEAEAHSSYASTAQGKIEIVHGHLPVKDILKGMYRTARYKTLQGCFLWLMFLGLNSLVFMLVHDTAKIYEQQSALDELFLDEEIPGSLFKKNFHDVQSKAELWDWIDGILVPGVYPDYWYNGKLKAANKRGYIISNTMRVVGGIRIRQHRVPGNSCYSRRFVKYIKKSQPERCSGQYTMCPFDRLDQSCFSEYRKDIGPFFRDVAEFFNEGATAEPLHSVVIPEYSTYNASKDDDKQTRLPPRYVARQMQSDLDPAIAGFGIDGTYGYVGFYQDLPPANRSAAVQTLKDMKDELWMDDGTRAIALTFTVYNTMSRSATVCRFTVEFSESGRVNNLGKFYTFPLVVYGNSGASTQRAFLEALSLALFIHFVLKEVKKGCRMGATGFFFRRKSTILELGILAIHLAYFVQFYGYVYEIVAGVTSKEFHVMSSVYTDYFTLGRQFKSISRLGGVAMIAGSIKIIKFIALSKQAMLLIRTLLAAKDTLIAYSIFFITLWIAFAYWGQALYGDRVWQFSKFPIAMLSLFRLMLADSELNYETLFRINADYTPLFYFLFQFVFLVLVMNMLIAILVSQFEAVVDLSTSEEKWKKEVPSLTSDVAMLFHIYTYRCRHRCCRNEHALKMTESIKSARSLYAEDPIKWGEAYTKSCVYWKGCEEWEFLNLLRTLAHIGKDSQTGPTVNLLDLLEKLYIQCEINAQDAIQHGAIDITDGRMPIASISASRILLMICNAPPALQPGETSTNAPEVSLKTKLFNYCCCSNYRKGETPVDTQRRLYKDSKAIVVKTIQKYKDISESILVAPVISDAEYWTNMEAVVGESLKLDLDDKETANCMFHVRMSISAKAEHWQTVFMDTRSAQVYILTPVDKQIKSSHQVRRSMNRSTRKNSLFGKKRNTYSDVYNGDGSSGGKKKGHKSGETWFGKDSIGGKDGLTTHGSKDGLPIHGTPATILNKRSTVSKRYFDNDGALWTTCKKGGRIKKVLDMLDLQQVQIDKIDLQLVTLFFEDSVGASYTFRFNSYERRRDFLFQVVEVQRRMDNGHGWSAENEDTYNDSSSERDGQESKLYAGGVDSGNGSGTNGKTEDAVPARPNDMSNATPSNTSSAKVRLPSLPSNTLSAKMRRASFLRKDSGRKSNKRRTVDKRSPGKSTSNKAKSRQRYPPTHQSMQEPSQKGAVGGRRSALADQKSLVLPSHTNIFRTLAEEVEEINGGEHVSDMAAAFTMQVHKEPAGKRRNHRRSLVIGGHSGRKRERGRRRSTHFRDD